MNIFSVLAHEAAKLESELNRSQPPGGGASKHETWCQKLLGPQVEKAWSDLAADNAVKWDKPTELELGWYTASGERRARPDFAFRAKHNKLVGLVEMKGAYAVSPHFGAGNSWHYAFHRWGTIGKGVCKDCTRLRKAQNRGIPAGLVVIAIGTTPGEAQPGCHPIGRFERRLTRILKEEAAMRPVARPKSSGRTGKRTDDDWVRIRVFRFPKPR
ncbi:MAG: hypothetical protein HY905_06925 [Deltaproteobacteria bacterium]|nr:hypothetical protein [Deltaproteobacteria bacterium]